MKILQNIRVRAFVAFMYLIAGYMSVCFLAFLLGPLDFHGYIPYSSLPDNFSLEERYSDIRFVSKDQKMVLTKEWVLNFFNVDKTYPISHICDIASYLERIHAYGFSIERIRILGHGNNRSQFIGDDDIDAIAIERSSSIRNCLTKIGSRMQKEGEIILEGCQVGKAKELLSLISKYANKKVIAYSAIQRMMTPSYDGNRVACNEKTCDQQKDESISDKIDGLQVLAVQYIEEISNQYFQNIFAY